MKVTKDAAMFLKQLMEKQQKNTAVIGYKANKR